MTLAKTATGSTSLSIAGSSTVMKQITTGFWCSATALLWATTALAQALPTGGSVVAGSATLSQPSNTQLNINQNSNAAIVNFNSFSIGEGARVDINQPGAASVFLGRVTGDTTSQIHGQLNANGQVHLVNPNGIFIGPNGSVSTAGFVASSLNISNEDFLNGTYRYTGNGNSAAVENAGTISIVPGGYAALIGGRVSNSGLIRVPLGKVGLGAGEQVTLDVSGDGFLQVAVPSDTDDALMEALVSNSGRIEANGGSVHLQAASARNAARQVINMSGVIEARSVSGRSGAVVLGGSGGGVQVSGTIDTSASVAQVASSPRPVARPGSGGSITITGEAIALTGATLRADGLGAGDGGTIRVGGDYQGGGDLQTAQTTFVDAGTTLSADAGDRGDGGRVIVWSDDFTNFNSTISARGGANGGDGGFAEVSGLVDLRYRGLADLRAPKGEVGTLLLDPQNITIPGTLTEAGLEAQLDLGNVILDTSDVVGTDDGNITINADIDWISTSDLRLNADNAITFNGAINAPNGSLTLNALGAVDGIGLISTGAGGTIDVGAFSLLAGSWEQVSGTLPSFAAADFSISSGASFLRALAGDGTAANPFQLTDVYGLQGIGSAGRGSQNYELANNIDASVTAGWTGGFDPIGNFSGTLDGNRNIIDGLVIDQGTGSGGFVDTNDGVLTEFQLTNANVTVGTGGIVASFNTGEISGVAVSGSIKANNNLGGAIVGGLVGNNTGTVVDSFSTASVNAFLPIDASANFITAGGLVGLNFGDIERSHSLGNVTVEDETGFGELVGGGLVGSNFGLTQDSYAQGAVVALAGSGLTSVGGLAGSNAGGSVERSYSTGVVTTTGSTSDEVGGLIGNNSRLAGIDTPVFGTVTASFWDVNSSGQTASDGGTALTTAQFQDTQGFSDLASAQGWDFDNVWAPGSAGFLPANYSTSPVVFAIPDPTTAIAGQTAAATTTGTVSGGPSQFRFGPDPDTLNTSPIFQSLTFASQNVGPTTFTVDTSNLNSTNGQAFRVVALGGSATITPAIGIPGGPGSVVPPQLPPVPTVDVTPTVDTDITDDTGGGGTAVNPGVGPTGTTDIVEDVSADFEDAIASCEAADQGLTQYLDCLAEALDDFAGELDSIANDLPAGLEEVGDIIRDASAGIRAAGDEANRRLALATTAAQRDAIRRDAVNQARAAIQTAQTEIRKAITLIRASDPELAGVERQQIDMLVAAVGSAEISLSRAIGL